MKVGDVVLVTADWSTFRGERGRVTQVLPYLMVATADDPRPMRFGETEVVCLGADDSRQHVAGAE